VRTGSIPGSGSRSISGQLRYETVADNRKPIDLTSRLVSQPSSTIPGVPPFVLSAPEGWTTDRVPGALAVFRQPQPAGDFYSNAILSHSVAPKTFEFKQAAQATWAQLKRANPDANPKFERMVAFGTNQVYLRGAELTRENKKYSQLHAIFFAPPPEGAKVVDYFQIVCVAPSDQIDAVGPEFMTLIGSFRFM